MQFQFYLTGNFNGVEFNIDDEDQDGKKRVEKLIELSGKGYVQETNTFERDAKNILVIGSFPGSSKIQKAIDNEIKIIDFEILQLGLNQTSPTDYFHLNNLTNENARRRCFQPGEEEVEIQSGLLNFYYRLF